MKPIIILLFILGSATAFAENTDYDKYDSLYDSPGSNGYVTERDNVHLGAAVVSNNLWAFTSNQDGGLPAMWTQPGYQGGPTNAAKEGIYMYFYDPRVDGYAALDSGGNASVNAIAIGATAGGQYVGDPIIDWFSTSGTNDNPLVNELQKIDKWFKKKKFW